MNIHEGLNTGMDFNKNRKVFLFVLDGYFVFLYTFVMIALQFTKKYTGLTPSFMAVLWIPLLIAYCGKLHINKSDDMKFQMRFVLFFLSAFFISSSIFMPKTIPFAVSVLYMYITLGIFVSFIIICIPDKLKQPDLKTSIIITFKNYYFAIIPVLFYLISQFFYITVYPQFDASLYLGFSINSVMWYQYTFASAMRVFSWAGHNSVICASYYSIANFLDNANYIFFNVMSVLLGALGIFSFAMLLRRLIADQILCALGATILALSPIYLINSLQPNPDNFIMVLIPITLCCLMYDYPLLSVAALCALCFSKLPGVMYSMCIMGSYFLISTINYLTLKKNKATPALKKEFRELSWFIPGLLLILFYYISINFQIWTYDNPTYPNKFVVDLRNINLRLAQVFILQFNWLLVFISVLGFALGIMLWIKKRNLSQPVNRHLLLAKTILSSAAVFFSMAAFILLFDTFGFPRYVNLSVVVLTLFVSLTFSGVYKLMKKYRSVVYACMAVICLLMFISSHSMIDPFSRILFTSHPFTQKTQYDLQSLESYSPGLTSQIIMNDGSVYNYEQADLIRLFDKFYKTLNITGQDHIYLYDIVNNWCLGLTPVQFYQGYDSVKHRRIITTQPHLYPYPAFHFFNIDINSFLSKFSHNSLT